MIITINSTEVVSFFDTPYFSMTVIQDEYGNLIELEIIEYQTVNHDD
jgi:hypothetical protein